MSNSIKVSTSGHTGTIVIDGEDERNFLSAAMVGQLEEALDDLYYTKAVRALVLTGSGNHFCSGLQPQPNQEALSPEDQVKQWGEEAGQLRDLLVRVMEITKPVIAAVNGPALSAGAALVTAADCVVAGKSATFGVPDTRMGLVGGLATTLVSFRLGAGNAARLALTAGEIDATEGHRLGLFHEVVEDDQTWARANALAGEIAGSAPEAIQLTKRLINETLGETLSTQLSAAAVIDATARTTEAAAEGIAAQLEGRKPEWK
ncbi:MAG: enoyl-CoA hydratase/isomerase family protein [Lacipirellulaceae bacterium]